MYLSHKNAEVGIKLIGALMVNNLQFAEDIGFLTRSERRSVLDITTQVDGASRKVGLINIAEETKTMVIAKMKEIPLSINIQGEGIEQVE